MGKIRKKEEFLKKADIKIVKIDEQQFAFERYDETNKILVIASRTHRVSKVIVPQEYKNAEVIFHTEGSNDNILALFGAIVFKK